MKKKNRKGQLVRRIAVALVVVVAAGSVFGWFYLKSQDRTFDKFRDAGAGINSFLGSFSRELEGAVAKGSVDGLLSFYSADYSSPRRGHWKLCDEVSSHGVSHSWLRVATEDDGKVQEFDREKLRAEWSAYLQNIATIDGASMDGAKVSFDDPDRGLGVVCKINITEEIEVGKHARVTVKYILNGRDRVGRALQDRFFFRFWLRSTGEGDSDWEIMRDELLTDSEVANMRVVGESPGFRKLDLEAAGLVDRDGQVYLHQRDPLLDPEREDVELKFAVIQHAGAGLSACDYDGDGWVDLFFCDGVECRLFRNLGLDDGMPKFRNVTETAGLAGIGRAHSAIFADFNNDGIKDLFVSRYEARCLVYLGRSRTSRSVGERNDDEIIFEEKSAEMGLNLIEPCVSACFLDYDRDGFIDIYIAVNGDAKTEIPRIPFFARNGKANRLLRNIGGTKFEDVTESAQVGDTGWSLAVACGDIDADGWVDLVVANDFGRKNIYRNRGDGTFHECAKESGTLDFSGGMGIAIGDLDGDERMDLYTSNIYSNQRWLGEEKALLQFSRNLVRSKWLFKDFGEFMDIYAITDGNWRSLGKMAGEGNSLFLNRGEGKDWKFDEARESCTNRAGWGWGVALADVDNDTDLDIYAANGWITGKKADDL